MNVHGEYRFADGRIYKGSFKNNVKQGKGALFWENGDVYEGDFSED